MADIISRLKLESGEFDSKIKRAGQELLTYADHCKQTGLQMGYANRDAKDFAKALGDMQTTSRTARGQIGELSEAFVNLKLMYKQMTDEEKNNPFGQNLAASLDKLKTRIQDTKKDLASINQELSGSKFGQFGGIIDGIGHKMGVSANLTELLTSKTALMTVGIGAAVAAIYKGTEAWTKYNAELSKQDQQTQAITGLKGSDANHMTDVMRAISDTYKVDFRQAVEAANTLMSQFGASGSEAIQLIKDGMQGMIQGDGPKLLSMIQQYAPAFRDAGVSASQLVAVIHNSEGGIFTDQNMSAIVMGIKNIRLMTKQTSDALAQLGIDGNQMSQQLSNGTLTVFDALKQVASELKNVDSNSKTAGEVMQTVFGRQGAMAGTNLAKAIETLNTNLEETKKQTGELGDAYASLQTANERLNKAVREAFGYDGWEQMTVGIKTGLINALSSVLEILVRNKAAVLAVTATIGTYIAVTKAHTAAIWLQQKAQLAFNAAAKMNPYGLIAAGAVAAVTAIVSLTNKTKEATETQKAMAAAAERTKQAQAGAANTVSSSVGNVMASYQSLQAEWKTLKSEQEKNAFIKENADKFRDMGLAVNSAADAENVLVKNTAAVVNALKARAEAEAYGDIYKQRIKDKAEAESNPSVENGQQIYSVRNDLRGREYREQFSDEEKAYVYSHYQGRERDVIQAAGINSDSWSVSAARTEVERFVREYRNSIAQGIRSSYDEEIAKAGKAYEGALATAKEAENELSKVANTTTTKPTGDKGTKQQQTELQQNNALIEQLTQQYVKLSDAEKTADDEQHLAITAQKAQLQSQIGMLQQRNAEIQRYTAQAKNTPTFALNAQGLPALNDQLKQLRQAQSEAASLDVWRTYEQQIANVENRIAELTGKLATGRQATITIPVDADTETLTEQLKKVTDVTADDKTVTITADTQAALDKVLELTDQVEGRTLTIKVVATTDATATKLTDTNLGAFTSDLKKQIANAELGSELYNQLTSRLADTTALSTVIQTALKNSVDLSTVSDQMQGVWQQILGNVDVPDNAIQELVAKLNEQLAEEGIEPIKIDVKTGNLSGTAKEVGKNWQAAANAVQQVGSALQQIEDPAAKVVGIIAQAIATVAQGFASALARPESQTGGVWGWIAAAAAGTATMISTIASIKSATSGGFANGGIVPGNSFAGDNLRTSDYGINSGELILNRAQQGVIADALSSDNPSGNGGTGGQPYVMGETVYLGVNNHLRRNGQGEIVTTSMLRKRGIL